MLRIRGVPIGEDDWRELIGRLAKDHAATDLVARMRRALEKGNGLIATSAGEARSLLAAVDALLDRGPQERLLELRASLAAMVAREDG